MIRMAVLYPRSEGSTFDIQYYKTRHMKLVRDRMEPLGMTDCGVDEGVEGLGGEFAPFTAIGYVVFETIEEFRSAFAAVGAELVADVPNYTNIEPMIQISEYTQT